MEDYFKSNHARAVALDDKQEEGYYIPHLAVIKENSSTTQTRIVFNASSKSSNGKSLNDNLLVGATIQRDLVEKIMSFRIHEWVFIGDIVKMYRQINMHKDDWKFQKFVWRRNSNEPIKDYCLTTVTFGTASAPFTAVRTLHQLANDKKEQFPVAATILLNGSYVDDLHHGADSEEMLKEGRNELLEMLKCASFQARKFASNSKDIIV